MSRGSPTFTDSSRAMSPRPWAVSWWLLRQVADRFDVVVVEVEDEGAVVVRMVLRPQARCAVAPTARSESGVVEGAHRGAALDHEGDVRRRRRPAVAGDPELGLAVPA